MKRSDLKRKTPLRSDPETAAAFRQRGRQQLARRNGLRSRPDREKLKEQPRPRATFRARRPARTQPCAGGCGERAAHYHHWLEQEHIRVYARGLRLPEDERDALLRVLLRDERNLTPFCAHCHLDEKAGQTGFRAEDVPASAHEFAAELGPEWAERLRRTYPAAGSAA